MTWEQIRAAWQWLRTSAYERQLEETVLALEVEVEDLRRDNRALVNAQLKHAGVTALPDLPEVKAPVIPRVRRLSLHQRQRLSILRTSRMPGKEEAIGGKA